MSSEDPIQESEPRVVDSVHQLAKKMSHIKGWAIDANSKNDPTYPIRLRFEGDRAGHYWSRPAQQINAEGILQSNEHPHLTSVFGTSAPAANLSGAIRRYAFRFSEGRYRHWLLLLLADRINMVEGLVHDMVHGHVPHCLDERGFNAELKHNRKAVVRRVAAGVVVVGALALLLSAKKNR
jgi:hypothetical protein